MAIELQDNDYKLVENAAWIELAGVSIRIFKAVGGIVIQAWPVGHESRDSALLGAMSIHDDEVKDALKDFEEEGESHATETQ